MTKFKTGTGPHTGVHMIIVRNDLERDHPPASPDRSRRSPQADRRLPEARPVPDGARRLSACVRYGAFAQTNFQLFADFKVKGAYKPMPLGAPHKTAVVDGYTFHIAKIVPSRLKAIQSSLIYIDLDRSARQAGDADALVRGARARDLLPPGPLRILPHARLQPRGRRLYGVFAGSKVTGSSATPGKMTVGVLLPDSGTWRLFLQIQQHGKTLSAPFVLSVGS